MCVQRNGSTLVQIKGLRQCSSQEHEEHCPKPNKKPSHEATTTKPRNKHFFASKACIFFILISHNIIHNMSESTTNKKKTSKSSMRYQIKKLTT
jgi:hypothetical protein